MPEATEDLPDWMAPPGVLQTATDAYLETVSLKPHQLVFAALARDLARQVEVNGTGAARSNRDDARRRIDVARGR